MIEINMPYVEEREGKYYLCCEVKKNDVPETVYWGGVDKELSQYFLDDRADAFLVGALFYAVWHGEDIKCNAPVSEDLYVNIKTLIVPLLAEHAGMNNIDIYADTIPECNETAGKVGTAASGGVDSFYTILVNINHEIESRRITHLCINDVGHFNRDYGNDRENVRDDRYQKAKEIADELGLPLISSESNYYDTLYVSDGPAKTIMYGPFAILCIKKLWSKYYIASSYDYSLIGTSKLKNHLEYMELLFATALSTGKLTFYIDGIEQKRIDKTRYVSKYEIVKKYLHVCLFEKENCGKCSKCKRTLTQLEASGALEDFGNVFHLVEYKQNREQYMKWLWTRANVGDEPMDAEAYEDFLDDSVIRKLNEEEELLDKELIVIYGFSNIGKRVYKDHKSCVLEIIDNGSNENGVLNFEEFTAKYVVLPEEVVFVVASSNHSELFANQIRQSYPQNRIVIRDIL